MFVKEINIPATPNTQYKVRIMGFMGVSAGLVNMTKVMKHVQECDAEEHDNSYPVWGEAL